MQAAQQGGDNELHKSRQPSVLENFYGAGHRDTATCKENSAACVSNIRDTKKKTIFICCRGMENLLFRIG